MKKIIQFVADGAPGGGTNHVMQLLTGLGTEIRNVLITEKDSYLYDLARSRGIEVVGGHFFKSRIDRGAVALVKKTINQYQPDIVHCHGGRAAFFQSFLSRRTPTIYTVHGFHHARKSLPARSLGWMAEFRTMRLMDKILFVSDYDRQLAIDQNLLPTAKPFRVIHNGIEPLEPRSGQQRLGIGFVGRFVYQKNPELFLDVVERMPEQKFVMAGGGELEEKIYDEVKRRGLSNRLTLLGSLDHVAALELISKLDVLVMTPRWEGLPLLPLEAMFKKVPVVSTAVGGIPEIIKHRETGMLSQSEDAQQLADHVQALIDDEDLRNAIVNQACAEVHLKFSQSTMLDQIRRTYNNVLVRRPRGPRVPGGQLQSSSNDVPLNH
jgi:glycosyltransferase involved in cell wall biosynthesis